jgi:hypothetical protein
MMNFARRAALGVAACLVLAGCSGLSSIGGMDEAEAGGPSSGGGGGGSSGGGGGGTSSAPGGPATGAPDSGSSTSSVQCFAATARVPLDTSVWFPAGSAPRDYAFTATAGDAAIVSKIASIDPATDFGTVMNRFPSAGHSSEQRFSALVSTRDVESPSWAGLWMRIDDAQGNTLAFDNMGDRPIESLTGPYEGSAIKYEVVLDVAAQASVVNLGMLLAGPGQVAVFDAALEPVSADGSYSSDPTSWFVAGADPAHYASTPDVSASQCGRPVAHLTNAGQPRDFGTIMEQIAADEFRGKRVRLRAPISTRDVVGRVGLWMRVDGPAMQMLAFDNMQNRPIQGTTPWQTHDVVLDVPANARQIAYGVAMTTAGDAWVDVVLVDVVDGGVATTGP